MIFISFILGILKEAVAKKIILSLIIIYVIIIALSIYFSNLESVDAVQALIQATSAADFRNAIINIQAYWLLHGFTLFVIFTLFIILVSSFIPSMMKKGYIDLILSKPISRAKIILAHFTAGIIFIFLALLAILGVRWLLISIKSGVWNFNFLYSIFWLTFIFAVLYSLIILTASLTKSTVLTILINQLMLFPVSYIIYLLNEYLKNKNSQGLVGPAAEFFIKFLYYLFPKPWDLHSICQNIVASTPVASYQPVITSILFITVMLTLSIYFFSKKDY
jgi:ABC-type transport system involved in multi-copper enzyme maturation permease subunit